MQATIVYTVRDMSGGHKKKKKKDTNILSVTSTDRYRTVEELFEHAQGSSVYYTLLVVSAVIITAGLLLNNSAIVIGGMLVTPLLSPILVIGLGLAVGDLKAIGRVVVLVGKSFLLLVLGAFVLSVLFGTPDEVRLIDNSMRSAVLYLIVAIASGVAATFAWVRREVSEVIPGLAIAVSVVPPVALVGMLLADFNIDGARFYFLIFLFNLMGVIVGSLVVFSLLQFHRVQRKVELVSGEKAVKKK